MGWVKGWTGQRAVLVQSVHDGFGGENLSVGAGDDLFGLRVHAIDPACVWHCVQTCFMFICACR